MSVIFSLLLRFYSGADVTEPNSSDSRGERLDFFLKQEEPLTAEAGFLGNNESEEAGGGAGGGTISSVANLKAALMSKNSLLSLRAEMMGDDNPLLYEYLPKGGHSLSCKSLFTNTVFILIAMHTHTSSHASRHNLGMHKLSSLSLSTCSHGHLSYRKYTGVTASGTSVLCSSTFPHQPLLSG